MSNQIYTKGFQLTRGGLLLLVLTYFMRAMVEFVETSQSNTYNNVTCIFKDVPSDTCPSSLEFVWIVLIWTNHCSDTTRNQVPFSLHFYWYHWCVLCFELHLATVVTYIPYLVFISIPWFFFSSSICIYKVFLTENLFPSTYMQLG